jgi:hypothetical protein
MTAEHLRAADFQRLSKMLEVALHLDAGTGNPNPRP